ncbi:unnamed protein product [Rotaria socialis]|uniref:non-specific serine/threonine protein kinase n=1 Tax=Rotaria socialis TaxID=392032 RepID=A0A821PQS6_9BILA|nr:unnamed protein product [Rotaria socialis]CAF4809304.1 unnamed protein product [Rotaria socialis]
MATSSVSTNIPKKSVKDFKFVKEIGTGSYSTVFFAIEKATDRELAIKAVDKELIKRMKKTPEVFREKEILTRLNDCAFAVKLYCTFQNESTLYFGLTYCSNGDLLQYINDAGHFQEDIVRFYSAELVEALEKLHVRNIIHRDLKPENILLTDDMHIQLTDFGSAVIIDNNEVSATDGTDNSNGEKKSVERKNSFVGTAQFVAPEILQRGPVHIGSDIWSLGCVIYQMATGKHLFHGHHEYDIFNAVVRVAYKLPDDFPDTIGDLIQKLVRFKPEERLGSEETGGMTKLKEHPFFTTDSYETKWGNLWSQKSPLAAKAKLSSRPKDNE